MIEGLQGTMITGEEAMMTADHLIIMMIVAGMTMTENATIEDAMKKKIVSMTGLQDPRMVRDGVEEFTADVWFLGKYLCDCFRFAYFGLLRSLWFNRRIPGPVYFSYGWSTLSGVAYWRNRLVWISNGFRTPIVQWLRPTPVMVLRRRIWAIGKEHPIGLATRRPAREFPDVQFYGFSHSHCCMRFLHSSRYM
jgi:hypothetical protein